MLSRRGYQVKLDLTHKQFTASRKHAKAARWTYNYGVCRLQEDYQAGQPSSTTRHLLREIIALKEQQPWMREVSPGVFQESLNDLDKAFEHFLHAYQLKQEDKWKSSCDFPRFKSKKQTIGGARFRRKIRTTADSIHLPVLGRLCLNEQNYIPFWVKISSAAIWEKAGRWYVSLVIAERYPLIPPATGNVIGVALGRNQLAIFSNGGSVGTPQVLHKQIKALKRAARHSRRPVKGYTNSEKVRHQVARKRAHLSHICANALHQLTAHLVAKTKRPSKRSCVIVVEEASNSGVHKNLRWVPHILELGFGRFKRQLTYKATQVGVHMHLIAPQETLLTRCSFCGVHNEQIGPWDRLFACAACGTELDRDENHARNLKEVGKQTMIP